MNTYVVQGEIKLEKGKNSFERMVKANSESHARDKVLAELGSEHGVTRSRISVEQVSEE